ncbi:TlpA disulfide reductase family protein [Muricauda sp. MAR_2010_75]|jgi:thiol-disulfide isomerase/thioredoxin|uniref:TlpA family protein disulfide reductase n=1 Tax=Allomuricauda sp. MAR_2010_75 TaxID=1250232 RepID=UPI00056B45EC|nr:TlpA disulfide reductase family protein [Muricauda sp. MAR_2010_75]
MKNLLLLGMATLFLVIGCGNTNKKKSEEGTVKEVEVVQNQSSEGEKVKFPIYDFEGLEPLLHKEDDKTYVVNFWATWCKPCIAELPYFEKINAEQSDKVEVILVSLDMPSMWKSRLEPFVENRKLQSEVVILDDPKQNDWIPKVAEEWGGGIPATLIYNKDKRSFYERGFTYEELNTELNKFLN